MSTFRLSLISKVKRTDQVLKICMLLVEGFVLLTHEIKLNTDNINHFYSRL